MQITIRFIWTKNWNFLQSYLDHNYFIFMKYRLFLNPDKDCASHFPEDFFHPRDLAFIVFCRPPDDCKLGVA